MSGFQVDFSQRFSHTGTGKKQFGLTIVDDIGYIFSRSQKVNRNGNTIILQCGIKGIQPGRTILGINGNFGITFTFKKLGILLHMPEQLAVRNITLRGNQRFFIRKRTAYDGIVHETSFNWKPKFRRKGSFTDANLIVLQEFHSGLHPHGLYISLVNLAIAVFAILNELKHGLFHHLLIGTSFPNLIETIS